jgi:hypothetical protein
VAGGGVDGPSRGHGLAPATVQMPGQRPPRGRGPASVAVLWCGADAMVWR